MASTYVNDLRLNEMATGDESGNWGVVTNLNLELVGEALGYGTEGITTNADTHTSTIADGATDPVRAMFVKYTGTLDSACTITIAPNTINRMQFIENGTSGSQNIIISQGSGANITIPAGDTKAVYLDGAGSGAAVVDAFASLNVVDLKVQDDLTVTDDLIVNGDIDLEGAIDVNGTANLDVVDIDGAVDMASTLTVAGVVDVTDTTDSSDASGDTGALRTEGGASIAKKLYVGTDLDVDGTANLDVVDIDGAVDMATTLTLAGNADFNGDLDVDGTTETDALSINGTTITATATELNYTDGVTSAIQTQLDTKATTGKAIAMALVFG
jgi:cytoskeletal protein CcmA (bactofilin family)|tara:strand:+ start:388 stop:1371 length:984 start_codon:yes stop_codon:yes gene_type:complete